MKRLLSLALLCMTSACGASFVFETLPAGGFLSGTPGASLLYGNWAFSGGYVAETGAWATPRSGVDVNFNGDNAADRTYINTAGAANVGSGTTALLNSAGRTVAYLATNPNARYIAVGPGGTVNGGRNTLRLPGINNFDVAFSKRINVREGKLFELRAELYNAINHAQFTPGYPSAANVRPARARSVLGSSPSLATARHVPKGRGATTGTPRRRSTRDPARRRGSP